jgi:hypothetical protein
MVLRAHMSHIAYSYYITFMLIFPPAFYWIALYPCFACYSFESLAVGAIGQVLGFDYIDKAGANNLKLTERMSRDICQSPQSHVAEAATDPLSVMRAPATYAANYCLTDADLDGLYRLYPLCSGAKLTPGCLRAKSNLGYLRVALAFGACVARAHRARATPRRRFVAHARDGPATSLAVGARRRSVRRRDDRDLFDFAATSPCGD